MSIKITEYGKYMINIIDAVDQHIRNEKGYSLIQYLGMRPTAMTLIIKSLNVGWQSFVELSNQLDQSLLVLSKSVGLFPIERNISLFCTPDDMTQILYPNREFIRMITEVGISYKNMVLSSKASEEINQIQQQMVSDLLTKVKTTLK